jgi:hypothetical protein
MLHENYNLFLFFQYALINNRYSVIESCINICIGCIIIIFYYIIMYKNMQLKRMSTLMYPNCLFKTPCYCYFNFDNSNNNIIMYI